MLNIQKEIEFWTLILRDHGQFQYLSLSPNENNAIGNAKFFMELFRSLHQEAIKSPFDNDQTTNLIAKNKAAVKQFIEFKKQMLKKLLTCSIGLTMTPTFLNHMINEAEEFARVLCMAEDENTTNQVLEILRLHKVWIPDASGHANFIASQLDGIEGKTINQAKAYENIFDMLTKKANELDQMYEKTELNNGVIIEFNREVEREINNFINFLAEIERLRKECKILGIGTFMPLFLDHMIRE